MIEFYPDVRLAHIALAIATGALFTLRGLLVQTGHAALANHVVVRYLSYTIDTALLTAALMLLTMLRLSPLDTPWLAVKIALLVAYVVLGSLALKRAPTAASRRACFVGALAAYGLMIGIARSHDPRGWLLWLGS
jgi:uncharacterized membrane protein SirB2